MSERHSLWLPWAMVLLTVVVTPISSPKTVRNYVSSILDKLQVADRAEARIAAQSAGLGQDSL